MKLREATVAPIATAPSRNAEARLARDVRNLNEKWWKRVLRALAGAADLSSAFSRDEYAAELADLLKAHAGPEFERAASTVASGLGFRIDANTAAAAWSADTAPKIARGIADTTFEILAKAEREPSEMGGPTSWLDQAFAPARADIIAATEIPRATNSGGGGVADVYNATNDEPLERVWFTQEDERVCWLCGPLHKAPQYVWEIDFPEGPPAHPRCRCYVEYYLPGTAPDRGLITGPERPVVGPTDDEIQQQSGRLIPLLDLIRG